MMCVAMFTKLLTYVHMYIYTVSNFIHTQGHPGITSVCIILHKYVHLSNIPYVCTYVNNVYMEPVDQLTSSKISIFDWNIMLYLIYTVQISPLFIYMH